MYVEFSDITIIDQSHASRSCHTYVRLSGDLDILESSRRLRQLKSDHVGEITSMAHVITTRGVFDLRLIAVLVGLVGQYVRTTMQHKPDSPHIGHRGRQHHQQHLDRHWEELGMESG